MTHQFNIKIAERYGVNAALVIECLKYWAVRDGANGEDRTKEIVDELVAVMPYLGREQIQGIVSRLRRLGVLTDSGLNEELLY
jgi:hypothetical protein